MNKELREISRILCGYCTHRSGYVVAVEGLVNSILKGGYNGSFAVRTLGLYCMEREYLVGGKVQPYREWAENRILSMGYPVYLYQQPDNVASLKMRLLGNPAILMLEADGKILRVSIFTAKGIFAQSVCKSLLKVFEEDLPQEMNPLDQEETKNRKKASEKATQKSDKQEKERERQEKKKKKADKAAAKEKEAARKKAEKEAEKRRAAEERKAAEAMRQKEIESFEARSRRLRREEENIEIPTAIPYEDDSNFDTEDEFDL